MSSNAMNTLGAGSPAPIPAIPDSGLSTLESFSPFPHFACLKMGPGRRYFETVVVKGTMVLLPGVLRVAREQASIVLSDRYWDPEDAALSSLRVAGDLMLGKPGADVFVTGTARAPGGKPASGWDTAVLVRRGARTISKHEVRVTGPRHWTFGVAGWSLSAPSPVESVPIRYELAYGGAYPGKNADDEPVVYSKNPSGRGFIDPRALDRARAYEAPQWELPDHPVTLPNKEVPLAGYGPVARMWESRTAYAGTYDEAWEEGLRRDVASGLPPDYPRDFDLRFFQCAHPALQTGEPLAGDEQIFLKGLLPEGDLLFALPGVSHQATLVLEGGTMERIQMPLDTVHVDLDARRVHLSWRLTFPLDRRATVGVISLQRQARGG